MTPFLLPPPPPPPFPTNPRPPTPSLSNSLHYFWYATSPNVPQTDRWVNGRKIYRCDLEDYQCLNSHRYSVCLMRRVLVGRVTHPTSLVCLWEVVAHWWS